MTGLSDFIGCYSLSKTLRFELKPIGRTAEAIVESGILEKDAHRAESYQKVKKLIDRYHKAYIARRLSCFNFNEKLLDEFYGLYTKSQRTEDDAKRMEALQGALRTAVGKNLREEKDYDRIFKKELIWEDLPEFLEELEEKNMVEEFKDFTTYFTGFNENRKNMYSDEAQHTAIGFRLVHENLPKFIDNMRVFALVAQSPVAERFPELYRNMESYLNVNDICEMFTLHYYNMVLTQEQIEVYNGIIGGRSTEDGEKIQGLNEYINLYNQRQKDRKARLPKFKLLFKQILSDREKLSWLPDMFSDSLQVLEAIEGKYHELHDELMITLKMMFENLEEYDLEHIYIRNDLQLTNLSQKIFGDWNYISARIEEDFKASMPKKKKETEGDYTERVRERVKKEGSFSIAYLQRVAACSITDYYADFGACDKDGVQEVNLLQQIENCYAEVKPLLGGNYPKEKDLAQDKENVEKVKALLESIKALQHYVKPLLGTKSEAEKDERFYGEFTILWERLDEITPLYNKVRNFATRKPYSQEKIKINFENAQLLGGWDDNKESTNASIILLRDGLYYLGIMDKSARKLLDKDMPDDGLCFDKMVYKCFKDIKKMFPKCTTQLNGVKSHFQNAETPYRLFNAETFDSPVYITKEVYELNNVTYGKKKKFQKDYLKITGDADGYAKAVKSWIAFCMQFLKAYKSTAVYDFTEIEQNLHTFTDVSTFYNEVDLLLYKISMKRVSVSFINRLVEEGKLYLFQIYNKDFSPMSKGTPNMHTLYWKMLFDERNLKDVVYKLNGQAEVFFRKASIEAKRPTHPAQKPIENKNPLNEKRQSVFEYDLVKDRRYTVDKFLFHVPITMNFKGTQSGNVNPLVNDFIRSNPDLHFIGIDRGERHLLYLTVVDGRGKIKEQYSLNRIVNECRGQRYATDYHHLLEERGGERQKQRKNWDVIENIKELKQGYMSQVIHKITELMLKYKAVVVLEDLNSGFKRGRQCIEHAVYQQFEKALIEKLNYLVDKNVPADEPGGVLKAYQLTCSTKDVQNMNRQNGFVFYIPAWNTSKIDPVTGFVNLFDTRYENVEKAKAFFGKFKAIRYNDKKKWFEWSFDYADFTSKAEGTRTQWTLCTWGTRVKTFRNPAKNSQWDCQEVDLTEEFMKLFSKSGIESGGNLKEAICGFCGAEYNGQSVTEKEFYESLLALLKLTLQMRNSVTGTEIDYLVSPVADADGNFYDSRTCGASLPENADANGAYNIARKGMWVAEQIRNASDGKQRPAISNREWLAYAQEKPYLK
ncbi:MAG: type V CRISPR-associated protein Cas12a/Cpf1 [Alloprevotella sp.]